VGDDEATVAQANAVVEGTQRATALLVLTMALPAGPIGLVIVGPLLASWGPRPVLLFVVLGQFLATMPFAFFALRCGREEAPVTLEAA
jgi:hypothetical protein